MEVYLAYETMMNEIHNFFIDVEESTIDEEKKKNILLYKSKMEFALKKIEDVLQPKLEGE